MDLGDKNLQVGAGGVILGGLVKHAIEYIKRRMEKDDDRIETEIKSAKDSVLGLTLAVQELKLVISGLLETIKKFPKLESDINEAHARIREIVAAAK